MENNKSKGVSVGVQFVAVGEQLRGDPRASSGSDPLAAIRGDLDHDLVTAMIEAEPKLMAWLRADKAHVARFAMDPMGALRDALPHFPPAMIAKIAAIRAKTQRVKADLPGVTVDRFHVSVAPEKGGKS